MTLTKEPFTITKQEAQWVASALSRDTHREVLRYAALAYLNGETVLVSTDTHRLHILNLGGNVEHALKLIDIRRVLLEASFVKASHIRIAKDFSEVEVGKVAQTKKHGDVFSQAFGILFPQTSSTFPNFERVIPTTKEPLNEFTAVNARYLIDATMLAAGNNWKTAILGESNTRAMVFQPASDTPRWKAVVMPMALEWK